MANKTLRTKISLRRDDAVKFDSNFVPLKGEILFVDTDYGLRIKVGDGKKKYSELSFLDTENNIINWGYYFNEKFYTDTTYTVELEKSLKHVYIDKITDRIYVYDADNKEYVGIDSMIPHANSNIPGILKLYTSEGENTDGTMTQKAITDGISDILFAIDSSDSECLILDKPW